MPHSGATTLTGGAVVDGTGQIVLDNLGCTGTESRLVDCPNNGLGIHNCVHAEDAGVRCLQPVSSKKISIMLKTFIIIMHLQFAQMVILD